MWTISIGVTWAEDETKQKFLDLCIARYSYQHTRLSRAVDTLFDLSAALASRE